MASSLSDRVPRHGVVTAFDYDRGLGTVAQDGGPSFAFHCTAIADGSRQVEVGTKVLFTVAAGHMGRFEGRWLQPIAEL